MRVQANRYFGEVVHDVNDFSVAQGFNPGNERRLVSKVPLMGLDNASYFLPRRTGRVRTASGSDRIRKSPRIKNETLRKRITANRAEMNFANPPDPVATARGSDTASKRLG